MSSSQHKKTFNNNKNGGKVTQKENNNGKDNNKNNEKKEGIDWRKKAMEDPRFSKAFSDPKLKPMKKKQNKLKVDERFKEIFENQNYQVYGSKDIRGRKVGFKKKDPLERFYQKEESDKESDDEGEEEDEERKEERVEEESEEDDDDSEGYEVEDEGDYEDTDNEDLLVQIGDSTRRLAIQNLDWTYIKAVDLFVLCQSFVPPGGAIKSVTVYPSDFGLERMKEDDELGPSLFRQGEENESESDEEQEDEVDMERLRQYELDKLKYYYAVVECDGVETAQAIYNNSDGMEIEKTANVIDMRYIPDDVSFEGRQVRETADRIPTDYKPPNYQTKALQHTDVDCTWDQVDVSGRNAVLRRPVKKSELNQIDYSAYLAPASDEEDESSEEEDGQEMNAQQKEKLQKKERDLKARLYKNLLSSLEPEENEQEDMEIEFTSGLTESVDKLIKKKKIEKDRADESVFESSLRKKKEKKREAKKNRKEEDEDSEEDEADDLPVDSFERMEALEAKREAKFLKNVSGKSNKLKNHKKFSEDEEEDEDARRKREGELALMTMSDLPAEEKKGKKGYNLKTLIAEHSGSKRQKRKLAEKGHQSDEFKVDLEDERFKAVLEDPQFTLDPTSKDFKNTRNTQYIMQERVKKRTEAKEKQAKEFENPNKNKERGVESLVESVKKKTANAQNKKTKFY